MGTRLRTVRGKDGQIARALAGLKGAASLALVVLVSQPAAPALAAGPTKLVGYRSYRVLVPAAWPVYNLATHPTVCVRFDRHAVYLGRPGAEQRCPAHAVGRTEAILIEPLAATQSRSDAGAGLALPRARGAGASSSEFASHGALVTVTWRRHPEVIRRAVGTRWLGAVAAGAGGAVTSPAPPRIRSAGAAASQAGVYTGPGFDACAAPSTREMSAWGSSRYRAAGVYLGGANMACAQTNLTAPWVRAQFAAGWHLIPTYVGLQAPSNSCGCAGIIPAHASAEGAAAAADAIGRAQALGIGAGNPIYFDMEAYSQGSANTSAVLRFLSSWTLRLRTAGYRSGVYSSADSGISDLVAATGTPFNEPDDIWTADWNGVQTTTASYLPNSAWSPHHRLHQYEGAHDETHGGVTINIDGDTVDGESAGVAALPAAAPSLQISPGGDGAIHVQAQWTGANVVAWRILGGVSPATLSSLGGAPTPGLQASVVVHSAFPYFAAQALGVAGQVLATSAPIATPPRIAIYGSRAFVPSGGLGALPAGCFTGSSCHIVTTISAGRTVIARTRAEFVPAGGGVLHFRLSPEGRNMLLRAAGHRLSVYVSAREAAGISATTTLDLIPFRTSGNGPYTALTESTTLEIIGATDFVSAGGMGGILAGCFQPTPCHVVTSIIAGANTIARSGSEFLGVNELGYLSFTLTRQGRAMLARAHGNQLAAELTISDGSATASGRIRLVGFS